jgi:hypothetical protein
MVGKPPERDTHRPTMRITFVTSYLTAKYMVGYHQAFG